MQSTRRYLEVLHLRPAVKISRRLPLNINFSEFNARIKISEITEKFKDEEYAVGLEYRILVDAPDLQEAMRRANMMADGLSSFITLVTGVGLPNPRVMLCYEVTPEKQKLDFFQFFYDVPFKDVSRREISYDELFHIIQSLYSKSGEIFERVGMAIRWYRVGTITWDSIQQFISYWIGFESLDPLLAERLPGMRISKDKRPRSNGVERFFIAHVDEGLAKYDQMRRLRNGIVHSYGSILKLSPEADSLAPAAGNALLKAISLLLDSEPVLKEKEKTLTNAIPYRTAFQGHILLDKSEDLLTDPHFEPQFKVTKVYRPPTGEIQMTFETLFRKVISGNSKLVVEKSQLHGEGDGKMDNHEFREVNQP